MKAFSPIQHLDEMLALVKKNCSLALLVAVILGMATKLLLGDQLLIEHPWAVFLGALGIPVIYLIFRHHIRGKQGRIAALADSNLLSSFISDYSFAPLPKSALLWSCIWLLCCGGMSGLRLGQQPVEARLARSEIMVALDVSKSMLAQDVRPNRIGQAKDIVAQLLGHLKNDRIGLIVFAGQAYVQMPLTEDFVSAQLFLEAINTDVVPVQGTSLATAVDMAIKSYPEDATAAKSLIIITDGEDHEKGLKEALGRAVGSDIEVAVVGIGTTRGAPIPENSTSKSEAYKKDSDGATVITKMDETVLASMAQMASGKLFLAGNKISLDGLNDWVVHLKRDGEAKTAYQDKWHMYPFFFLSAGLLLLFTLWKP